MAVEPIKLRIRPDLLAHSLNFQQNEFRTSNENQNKSSEIKTASPLLSIENVLNHSSFQE
jgi:hypothetical protein